MAGGTLNFLGLGLASSRSLFLELHCGRDNADGVAAEAAEEEATEAVFCLNELRRE